MSGKRPAARAARHVAIAAGFDSAAERDFMRGLPGLDRPSPGPRARGDPTTGTPEYRSGEGLCCVPAHGLLRDHDALGLARHRPGCTPGSGRCSRRGSRRSWGPSRSGTGHCQQGAAPRCTSSRERRRPSSDQGLRYGGAGSLAAGVFVDIVWTQNPKIPPICKLG